MEDAHRPDDTAEPTAAPERLCRRCSTVTATTGELCPHCGASYVRRRRLPRLPAMRRRTRRVLVAALALLLIAGAAAGVMV